MTCCCGCIARTSAEAVAAFLQGEDKGHLDLPKARAGGFAGGLFAIFVPPPKRKDRADGETPAPETGSVIGSDPAPPAVDDVAEAQRVVFAMVSLLLPDRAGVGRARARLPHGRRYRTLPRRRRAGGGAAYRRRRSDRCELRGAGRAARSGAALARPGVEPAECVRPRRAVPLPVVARHRARADRPRQGADRRLQPLCGF